MHKARVVILLRQLSRIRKGFSGAKDVRIWPLIITNCLSDKATKLGGALGGTAKIEAPCTSRCGSMKIPS